MSPRAPKPALYWWLLGGAIVDGVGLLVLGLVILIPMLSDRAPPKNPEDKLKLPALNLVPLRSLAVQTTGRIMPFETAALEAVRNITGSARFEGNDPTTLVFSWMMLRGTNERSEWVDWESYQFILCDDRNLRRVIYADRLNEEGDADEAMKAARELMLYGKYVSPQDLRRSNRFKKLLDHVDELRRDDREKAQFLMTPEERKAEEVSSRLVLFDSISQNDPAYGKGVRRMRQHDDPMHFVALDQVRGGPWLSLAELRESKQDEQRRKAHADQPGYRPVPTKWESLMKDRLARMPQLYIKPERLETLKQFQTRIKEGTGKEAVNELAGRLRQRSRDTVKDYEDAQAQRDTARAMKLLQEVATTREDLDLIVQATNEVNKDSGAQQSPSDEARLSRVLLHPAVPKEIAKILNRRDDEVIEQLRKRIPSEPKNYHPEDQQYRMLHLNYLENYYPDLYPESEAWQKFPSEKAERLLACYDRMSASYKAEKTTEFDQASSEFMTMLAALSSEVGPYPGNDTIGDRLTDLVKGIFAEGAPGAPGRSILDLEMTFNRVKPFRWAWITMLGSLVLFAAGLALRPAGLLTAARVAYSLALAAFVGSLGFQVFGFFTRVVIAGRPPVSNMYETVIWVSFMSAIFALILEVIYRRGVIALAGALAATIGLVLADQLPLNLDPKISNLVPVLRSNFWLTIHVLTIVSSYAGGTLAWALGNVSLLLLTLFKPNRELVKTLSTYTYRGMQIAVLLLAAGTFLGGWWAAQSWGRFWGWDPKEVWALTALVFYVIPLHARFIGWVKDFGLAVSAVVCFAAIVMSWYGVNFVLGAGLHAYGFGGGGPWRVFFFGLLNLEFVIIASMIYVLRTQADAMPLGAIATVESKS